MKNHSLVLILSFVAVLVGAPFAATQTNSEVRNDEYEVFSAFINQVYLSEVHEEWFTLAGEKSVRSNRINRIEQVIVFPVTLAEPSNAYYAFANAPFRPLISAALFRNFLDKNTVSYPLEDKFTARVPHFLFQRTLEEARAYSEEAQRRRITYDDLFVERFPGAAGTLMFYRPGFDESRNTALLGVRQTDYQKSGKITSAYAGSQMVLLSKVGGSWRVKELFPKKIELKFDLGKCTPTSVGVSHGLGSYSTSIIGMEKGKCHLQAFYEIEGGYTRTECFVPTSLGEILVTKSNPFQYSVSMSRYCQKPTTGNIFFDNIRNIRRKKH